MAEMFSLKMGRKSQNSSVANQAGSATAAQGIGFKAPGSDRIDAEQAGVDRE